MKALVIGATGLIGSNVVRALLQSGHTVRAVRRGRSRMDALDGLDGQLEFTECELVDGPSIAAAARGCDWVFHAAGYYPTVSLDHAACLAKAVATQRAVLEACVKAAVGLLVYTSSLSTIARPAAPRPANEEDYYVPGSVDDAYFEAKWAMECECWRFDRDLRTIIVNPTICIGPGDVKPTSNRVVRDIALGRLPAVIDGSTNVIDVRDVAVGHVRAAEVGTCGDRYILGNENTTTGQLCERIAAIAGVRPPRVHVSPAVALRAAWASEVIAKYVTKKPPVLPLEFVNMIKNGQHYDVSKARRELDLPQTPVDVAIQDSLEWFRSRGRLQARR